MPRIYKQNCKECGEYYEKASKTFCNRKCMFKNKEWKSAQSKAHKKQPAWNKGIPRTAEVKEKLSIAHKGKKLSIEHKKAISEGGKGKKHSKESIKKMQTAQLGDKHWNWQGGVTELTARIRQLTQYRKWRQEVYMRDNYTCMECGARNGKGKNVYLNADHIKPFSLILRDNKISSIDDAIKCSELWDIKNGNTLCIDCHYNTKTFGVRIRQSEHNFIWK